MDTVDRETRSKIMASVGQKDTGAELLLRSAIHRIGLRYRLHDRSLPGSPDLVFPRFRAVVFVHGCYWHSHGCYRSTVPKSRKEFWTGKFLANRERDQKSIRLLRQAEWRVLTVWECALKGKAAKSSSAIAVAVKTWLESSDSIEDIPGVIAYSAQDGVVRWTGGTSSSDGREQLCPSDVGTKHVNARR